MPDYRFRKGCEHPEYHQTGGSLCPISDSDMDPREAQSMYRSKDIVEKPFPSMKSDRHRAHQNMDGERGLRCHSDRFSRPCDGLVTCLLVETASSIATKFITNLMRKLTLTVIGSDEGRKRCVYSNFNRSIRQYWALSALWKE